VITKALKIITQTAKIAGNPTASAVRYFDTILNELFDFSAFGGGFLSVGIWPILSIRAVKRR
jgi:hypothetical protein